MSEPKEVHFRLANGQVHGLWFDEFQPLYRELGIAAVLRASQIEWNGETAKWEVHLTDGECIGAFDRRDQAIAHEIAYLQARLWRRRPCEARHLSPVTRSDGYTWNRAPLSGGEPGSFVVHPERMKGDPLDERVVEGV
jgi:hypothetical protein